MNTDPQPCQKQLHFFSAVIFFLQLLVIEALDPDWIRIRIGVHPKMLDPDPDEINADPQPCSCMDPQHGVIKPKI